MTTLDISSRPSSPVHVGSGTQTPVPAGRSAGPRLPPELMAHIVDCVDAQSDFDSSRGWGGSPRTMAALRLTSVACHALASEGRYRSWQGRLGLILEFPERFVRLLDHLDTHGNNALVDAVLAHSEQLVLPRFPNVDHEDSAVLQYRWLAYARARPSGHATHIVAQRTPTLSSLALLKTWPRLEVLDLPALCERHATTMGQIVAAGTLRALAVRGLNMDRASSGALALRIPAPSVRSVLGTADGIAGSLEGARLFRQSFSALAHLSIEHHVQQAAVLRQLCSISTLETLTVRVPPSARGRVAPGSLAYLDAISCRQLTFVDLATPSTNLETLGSWPTVQTLQIAPFPRCETPPPHEIAPDSPGFWPNFLQLLEAQPRLRTLRMMQPRDEATESSAQVAPRPYRGFAAVRAHFGARLEAIEALAEPLMEVPYADGLLVREQVA